MSDDYILSLAAKGSIRSGYNTEAVALSARVRKSMIDNMNDYQELAVVRARQDLTKLDMAKRCRSCKKLFDPWSSLQNTCSPDCAIEYSKTKDAAKHREKAIKKDHREQLEKIKSRADHIKDAQKAFNAYIRARDEKDGCISCDRLNAVKYDCGHYRSTGAAGHLRFNEDNAHKQCARPCNQDLSGNPIEYRIRLIKKIGIERVEALENNNDVVKWSVDDIKETKKVYRLKLKELQCESK